MMQLKTTVIAIIFLGMLYGCGGSSNDSNQDVPTLPEPEPSPIFEFTEPVLSNIVFYQFSFKNNTKIAATSEGVYALINSDWVSISPATWLVFDVVIVSSTHYIASIQVNNSFSLAETTNSGTDWEIITNNFGGTDPNTNTANEKVQRIKYDESTGILYATGYDVLGSSNDFARTWSAVAGNWQGLARGLSALTINSMQQKVWFGGQGAIENPIFRAYSMTTGAITVHNDDISALLPIPSTVESVVFHPNNPDIMYAMGEGGIVQSSDGGDTWQGFLLDNNYRFYYNLVIDPNNTDRIYAAGWSKDINSPQALNIERTLNGGLSWESYVHPNSALYGGMRSMAHTVNQDNSLTLHIGLQNGGVVNASFSD